MSSRFGLGVAAMCVCAVLLAALPAAAATGGIDLENRDFTLPGGDKVRPFDVNGTPLAPNTPVSVLGTNIRIGGVPGWTFSGPGTEVRFNAIDPLTMMPFVKGDSSAEPGGGFGANSGNHLTLSTLDGTAFQTTAVNVSNIPPSQAYRLTFEALDAFTIDNAMPNPVQIQNRAQLTARLYYDNAGVKTTLISQAIDILGGTNKYTLQIAGGSPALGGAAIGKPIGIEFDTTSIERNMGLPAFPVAHSWVAVDNVLLQITGTALGDLDGDGDIDAVDYGIVRDNQQIARVYEAQGELTGDNFVNLNDFREFKRLYAIAHPGSGGIIAGEVPEPSSLVLVLVVAAAIAGIRRRCEFPGRVRACLLMAAGIAAVLALAARSEAVQLLYEPFNIPPYVIGPATLATQNPASTFFTGPWTIGAAGEIVVTGSLSYLGSPSQGGSVTSLGEGRVGRYLATPWDASTAGTYYIGFQASYGTVLNPATTAQADLGFRTTEFWPAGGTIGVDQTALNGCRMVVELPR